MSTTKPTVLLEHHLKELKLPTMLREYAAVAGVCSNERADYPTYLLRLCERELIDRERRAAERRIKAAKFPVIKTLDSFDFTAQPSINESMRRRTCFWSATAARAKRTWPAPWPLRPVPRGAACGSSPSAGW